MYAYAVSKSISHKLYKSVGFNKPFAPLFTKLFSALRYINGHFVGGKRQRRPGDVVGKCRPPAFRGFVQLGGLVVNFQADSATIRN